MLNYFNRIWQRSAIFANFPFLVLLAGADPLGAHHA